MKKIIFAFAALFGLLSLLPVSASAQTTTPFKALVVYDAPSNDQFGKLGMAYAIEMRNLLGHFDSTVDLLPVESYTAGKLEGYQATFYIGDYYNNPLPAAFLADVAATAKTVVWFKYNLWQLAWDPLYNFSAKYGVTFGTLRGMNAAPTAANPAPGFFDTVTYKGQSMVKYYAYTATTGVINADPDLGVPAITDATKAQALVNISNPKTQEVAPYITRAGNFWYVGDVPFSYQGPRDRYLVLCDIIHDMVGVTHATSHRALVRLEDVSAITTQAAMKTLTDYLLSKKIPFSIATIPHYLDPLGAYNGGVPEEIPLAQATALKASLKYALTRGGKIVMHGYTHQYGNIPNPHTGVSGDDYEFWQYVTNTPVPEDSSAWALQRLQAGKAELAANGYTPFAWEAPHYQSSPLSMRPVPGQFTTTYQRAVYYTSDTPSLNVTTPARDFAVGQFYPYIIKTDYYGQRIIPENLGNIEYDIHTIDPASNYNYTSTDLCTNAKYATVIRDSFASFFFHPFWLEPALKLPGLKDFQAVVTCVTSAGYTWVDASTAQ